MPARCPRDKETKECLDPGCDCVECKHGTCGCESYTGCGDDHRKQDREHEMAMRLRRQREDEEYAA